MPTKLSLVLPVYDQADHIAAVVRGLAVVLERLAVSFEIILVPNGGAKDGKVCRDLAREVRGVRCIEIAGRGWGRAVRSGIAHARGELICFTNSARTQAEDLSRIVTTALAHDGTVVKAVRLSRHGLPRRIGSRLFNLLCNGLLGVRTADVNGTPKVFPAAASSLRNLLCDDDLVDLEFMWRCRQDKLEVIEIEIHSDRRHGGRSTTNLETALKLFAGTVRFWRRTRVTSFGR